MPTRIRPDQIHIPSRHRWFFEHACGADPLRYLAGRRLLEVSLHAPGRRQHCHRPASLR